MPGAEERARWWAERRRGPHLWAEVAVCPVSFLFRRTVKLCAEAMFLAFSVVGLWLCGLGAVLAPCALHGHVQAAWWNIAVLCLVAGPKAIFSYWLLSIYLSSSCGLGGAS